MRERKFRGWEADCAMMLCVALKNVQRRALMLHICTLGYDHRLAYVTIAGAFVLIKIDETQPRKARIYVSLWVEPYAASRHKRS